MNHPLQNFLGLITVGVENALTTWADRAAFDDDRNAFLAVRDQLADMTGRQVMRAVRDNPQGMAALRAAPTPGKPHPFLDWLTHGGAQWLYAIAQIIAAMFGLILPPLPPLPPIPTP